MTTKNLKGDKLMETKEFKTIESFLTTYPSVLSKADLSKVKKLNKNKFERVEKIVKTGDHVIVIFSARVKGEIIVQIETFSDPTL